MSIHHPKSLMLIRVVRILILVLGAAAAYGQQPFWKQTNGPEGAIITSLACSANDNVFALTSANVLYRSTDQGNTWEDITSKLSGTNPSNIISSPEGTLYVTSVRNTAVLFNRSLDNGDTWIATTPSNVSSVVDFKASFGSTLYMVGSLNGSFIHSIFKSTDYGNFWTQINGNISPSTSFGHVSIAPNGNLFIDDGGYFYRSGDQGSSWTLLVNDRAPGRGLTASKNGYLFTLPGSSSTSQYTKIVNRSTDNGRTWDTIVNNCSAIGIVSDTILLCLQHDTLITSSSDYGNSWKILLHEPLLWDYYGSGSQFTSIGAADSKGHCYITEFGRLFVFDHASNTIKNLSIPFAFTNSVLMIPGNELLVSTNNGLARTTDKGDHWSIDPTSNPYDTSELTGIQIYSFARDSAGGILGYSHEGNLNYLGGLFRSTNRGHSWKPSFPLYSPTLVDPVQIFTAPNGNLFALWFQSGFQITRSSDLGVTWDQIVYGLPSDFPIDLACDKFGNLYTAIGQAIYRSSDNGDSWQFTINLIDPILYKHIVSTSTVTCFASTLQGEIYVGTSHDGVIVSSDGGIHWQVAGDNLDSTNISALFAAPNGDIFGFSKFGSLDSGIIYKKFNTPYWVSANSGLGYVGDLQTMTFAPDGTAYLGTRGRGVWMGSGVVRSTQVPPQTAAGKNTLRISPNPASSYATLTYSLPERSFARLDLCDALGRTLLTFTNGMQEAGEHSISKALGEIASGIYFARLATANGSVVEKIVINK